MGDVMQCRNCKHFRSYGDAFNPRTDGSCEKERMTVCGPLEINVDDFEFCYWFEKKVKKERKVIE